jgi:hypothetical protein
MVKKGKKCSTSENPFFEVTLTAYYAHGHFLVSLLFKLKIKNLPILALIVSLINYHDLNQLVPREFSKEHLNNFEGRATLQVGKDMPLKVNIKFGDNYRICHIRSGWKLFREKYNLQVGDSCKFVMIQRQPLLFAVFINRATKGPSPKMLHGWRQVGGNLWKNSK